MPSLIDRVTRFARSPQGKSLIQKATDRISGGTQAKGKGGRQTRRGRRQR
ncbi:MAG: hypothetical protein JW895_13570 [Thermoleophilaceae bacterium]|nr:hypothetical protein [Thermoleophilaceae bacterium]